MDEQQAWDRGRDAEDKPEPMLWFRRFDVYRLAGPGRSKLAIYNAERKKAGKGGTKSVPSSWDRKAAEWDWAGRAAAWDAFEAQRERDEREAEERRLRQQAREVRRGLLGAGHNLLARTMVTYLGKNGAIPDAQTMGRILGAIEKLNRDSRAEYGDLPAQRHEVAGKDGGPLEANVSGHLSLGLADLADLAELDDEELDARIERLSRINHRLEDAAASAAAAAPDGAGPPAGGKGAPAGSTAQADDPGGPADR